MKSQRGGFVLGLIIGLLVGLALALGVALYIAKVPIPFVNKVPQRTPEQDAAEVEKNKNWDPNSALSNKTPVKTSPPSGAPPPAAVPPPATSSRDPAAILADKPGTTGTVLSTRSADEALGSLSFFVQAGAYGKQEDAEQQRAKLAMMGWGAKITEREQNGRNVYRVRVGPFDKREDATQAKEKLEGAGVESALVSVQK
jgi:cell division protein FtsN